MTVYKHDPLDSTSLGNNNVFALLEDRSGTLWIGTAGGGLNRFDRATEQFTRLKHDPDNPNSLSADVVSALFEDRSGVLWVGTWAGLNKLDPNTGKITQYVHDADDATSVNPHWIRTICEDSTGLLWVGTDGGISRLNRESGKFTHFVEDTKNPSSLSSNAVNAIIKDRAGTMWIGSWGGLDRFDHESQHFINFRAGGRVSSICEDPGQPGGLWIGTENHLLHFDRATGRFTRFVHDPANPSSLSSNAIQTIYEDQTGALWIGTQNRVNRLDRGQFWFKQIMHNPDNANSLSRKSVMAIHEGRNGALWIATARSAASGVEVGLDKLDLKTGRIEHLFANLRNDDIRQRLWIHNIYQDRSGVLWFGTSAGLGRYDPKTEQFTRFVHDPNDLHSISGNQVWQIHEDQSGKLWVAIHRYGSTGIDRFDREQERFSRIELVPEISSGLNQKNGVSSISEGQSGRLWFATMNYGIFALNPGSNEFIQFNHEPGNPYSLSHGWVGPVHEDRTGMVWAAPWYGGLNKLDPETGQVTVYTEKHGLASNYINSILEDDHGRIWMTTLNGLSRFDPRSETFKNFDRNDGVLNNFNFWNASAKSRNGELYFGGEDGIDYVHPDSIRDNPHIPPVVFTRFTRYNSGESKDKAIVEKGISVKRRLDLTHEDHTLTFEFAALNFRAPHKNQYAYKLEGFNDDWIHLGNKHDVTFTNLDPGEYTLRVKGSNNDGVWNEEGAALVINISPPWWKTWWAYSLYALFLLGMMYGLRFYELNRQSLRHNLELKNVEAEKLQELDRLKSRFFAGISHEFRTPLTLISGPVKQLLSGEFRGNISEQYLMILRNCNRLLRLINQLLDLSRLESGKITLQAHPQDIVALTRQLTMTFESLAGVRDIELQFSSSDEPVMVYLERQHYEKIITNLLFNALKFTPEGGSVIVDCGLRILQLRIWDLGLRI
jgi:ligand-binding sensor domain-containing protein